VNSVNDLPECSAVGHGDRPTTGMYRFPELQALRELSLRAEVP